MSLLKQLVPTPDLTKSNALQLAIPVNNLNTFKLKAMEDHTYHTVLVSIIL